MSEPAPEFGPVATHARLFDEYLESIEDGVDKSIGRGGTGILGDVEPDLLEVLLGKAGQPITTSTTSWCELDDRAT